MKPIKALFIFGILISIAFGSLANNFKGVGYIDTLGYKNCILLKNATTTVVIEPNCGGRVLVYALNQKNVIYTDRSQDGFIYNPAKPNDQPKHITGGRFDLGPSLQKPSTVTTWLGKYNVEITDDYKVTLSSQIDSAEKYQMIRVFKLSPFNSELKITQDIINHDTKPKSFNYWSRTFATGKGIAIVPVRDNNRFPKKYITYDPGRKANLIPEQEPNVNIDGNLVVIKDTPKQPKFVFDSDKEWLAYITTNNILFLKEYRYYPSKIYGEATGASISVWYNGDEMVELEPIGPVEKIYPGQSISFTEKWSLYPYKMPIERNINPREIERFLKY